MFLTLEEFLYHFPEISMSREEFARTLTVTYAKPQSLRDIFDLVPGHRGKPIIKKPETDKRYLRQEEIIDYFYEIVITNRHKYLACFFGAYFDFKDPRTLKWDKANILSTKKLDGHDIVSLQKNDPSKRLIRNLFYLELLDKTKVTNTVKSSVSFWQSLLNLYNELRLEDRFFAPSSIDQFLKPKGTQREARSGVREINYNALFYLFQAYQPKASIFNPYSIKWLIDNVIDKSLGYKGQTMFTPVLSWGSYLMAFMHSGYQHYVGVDVMPSVCDKVEFLADWYAQEMGIVKQTEIRCQPSETLLTDRKFLTEYKDYFDTIIVCPPYFDMEVYPEGPQSLELYPNYKEWLDLYWRQTVDMCCHVTKPGGVFALIANDYYTLEGDHYPLAQDLQDVTSRCYTLQDMIYLQNRTSPLRVNAKDRTERLYLYKKFDSFSVSR